MVIPRLQARGPLHHEDRTRQVTTRLVKPCQPGIMLRGAWLEVNRPFPGCLGLGGLARLHVRVGQTDVILESVPDSFYKNRSLLSYRRYSQWSNTRLGGVEACAGY